MNFRKSFAGFITTVVLMVAVVFAFSTPAQAAASDCTAFPGTICFHDNTNFTGSVWRQYPSQINGCRNLPAEGWNDRFGTAYNLTSSSYQLYLYQHINCGADGGYDFIMASGSSLSFTGSYEWWNNKVSSIKVVAF
jgi:hypothetical protein